MCACRWHSDLTYQCFFFISLWITGGCVVQCSNEGKVSEDRDGQLLRNMDRNHVGFKIVFKNLLWKYVIRKEIHLSLLLDLKDTNCAFKGGALSVCIMFVCLQLCRGTTELQAQLKMPVSRFYHEGWMEETGLINNLPTFRSSCLLYGCRVVYFYCCSKFQIWYN